MSEPINLDAIERRIQDCATYNFGMRAADRLAHEDAPALLAEARRAREIDNELAELRSDLEDMLRVANGDGIEAAKSHAIRTARIAARRRNLAMETIRATTSHVIDIHEGTIGSHFEGCWKHHVACLAVIITELVDGAVKPA